MSRPTVAAAFPNAFLEFAVARGADRAALIERSRLSSDDLKEPSNRVALQSYLELMQAGIEMCGEPALALIFGETVRTQDLSIVGLIGEQATSWESGREQMNRYAPLMIDSDDGPASDLVEFIQEGDDLWLRATTSLYTDYPLLAESAFARTICGVRELAATGRFSTNGPFPKAIRFTHAEPGYRAEYDRIFRVPISFSSDMNAVLVDKAFLAMNFPQPNPYLSQILTAHAEELLNDLERSKSMRGRVEGLLIPILHTGNASIEAIAEQLSISRQTLFRKLKAEGVTFEKVLDELRHKLALEYLNRKHLSVNETAYLLGFSEPAAFSRAFKRWTGSSPKEHLSK